MLNFINSIGVISLTLNSLIIKIRFMDSNSIGYWDIKKEKLKQKYQILSDKDLCFNVGKEKEMIEILGY